MKQKYIPVKLGDEKVGIAMVENNFLVVKIPDRILQGMTWGKQGDESISHISLTYAEADPHSAILTIHQNTEGNE